jgi:hypothetical protein
MATRLYYSGDTFSAVTFSEIGSWGDTVADHVKQYMYNVNPGDMGFVLEQYNNEGQGTHKFRTYVSELLDSGINFTGGTFTWVQRWGENSTSANSFPRIAYGVMNSSGTFYATGTWTGGSEMTASVVTPTSRNLTFSHGLALTTVNNDRLVFEIGWDQDAAGSTYDACASRGNTSGTDLSSTDGDSDIQNPWFESSVTLAFGGDGGGEPEPPATDEDWGAAIYIAGVLDEWV